MTMWSNAVERAIRELRARKPKAAPRKVGASLRAVAGETGWLARTGSVRLGEDYIREFGKT